MNEDGKDILVSHNVAADKVPNVITRKAMSELERGDAEKFSTVDELIVDLNSYC